MARTPPTLPPVDLSRAERLAVAGLIAAPLRDRYHRPATRKLKLTDKDGKVVGEITDVEYAQKVAKRAGIELDVTIGERPKAIVCQCGKYVKVPLVGLK